MAEAPESIKRAANRVAKENGLHISVDFQNHAIRHGAQYEGHTIQAGKGTNVNPMLSAEFEISKFL
jgi:hypothetical protein